MADFSCTLPFLLYPSIFLILFFSSINHHRDLFNFLHFNSISPPSHSQKNTSFLQDFVNETRVNNMMMVERNKSHIEVMEEGLARVRAAIKQASWRRSYTSSQEESSVPRGAVYKNPMPFIS